jgi:hypothetical protein
LPIFVHSLLATINAKRQFSYIASLKHGKLGARCLVMNVRPYREESHNSCRIDNSPELSGEYQWAPTIVSFDGRPEFAAS